MKRILFFTSLVLMLVACGGPKTAPTAAPTSTPRSSAPPTAASAGIDLTKVDMCTLVPKGDIEAVLGPLGKEPKADPPNGPEIGCTFYNEQGEYVDLSLNPVGDWGMLRQLQPDAKDLTLDGDKAFSADKFYGVELWVLRQGKAIIQVRLSTKDLEQAKKFVPKVAARLP